MNSLTVRTKHEKEYMADMTVKDWTDLLTGGGAIISAIAAGVAAWASRTSAKAAEKSSKASLDALATNERIANNDWRIRLMDERMQVWRAFDDLMTAFSEGYLKNKDIDKAEQQFQKASFLFDAEVNNYLIELLGTVKAVTGCRNPAMEESLMVLIRWLSTQHQEGKDLFMKHMSLLN
jgi:hypothetical protein